MLPAMYFSAPTALRVLLIDDHTLFREGLALLLHRVDPRLQTLEAGSFDEALAGWPRFGALDLALVDLHLPGLPGLDGLSRLRAAAPALPVVVVSSDDDPATVLSCIDRGAMGFIPKSASGDELVKALRTVLAGQAWLPPQALQFVPGVASRSEPTPEALGLTPRQADVLRLIVQGLSTKLICRALALSESTVKTHTAAVLRALNVTTRTQAVVAALRLGIRLP
jgi:DNA-binding NarL/FixJ family response regulator